jgi:hypothetical protein
MPYPQVHEVTGHETPVLTACDGFALVTAEFAQLVAAASQYYASREDCEDCPPALQSQVGDARRT